MITYDENEIVQTALEDYFEKNDFGKDGGLDKKWVKIKITKHIFFPLPNPNARKKALVWHDIHHIVTGYDTKWKGEVAIGAWEIASGCGKLWVAWLLDFWTFAIGLFIFPKSVFDAFIRGRRTLNLYHETFSREEAGKMKIGELRKHLKIDDSKMKPATGKEIFSFINYSIFALLSFFIPFVLPYIILFCWLLHY